MRFTGPLPSLFLLLAAASLCPADGLKERVVLPAHDETVSCLAFSPDGKTLATGSRLYDRKSGRAAGEVKLWDVEAGRQRTVLHGHSTDVQALAFAPDGRTLATGTGDNTIKVWDLETGKERLSVRSAEFGAYDLAFSPDGKSLWYAGYLAVRRVDAATGKELSSFKRPGRGGGAVFSSDRKTFATPNHQDVDLYDTATGKERLVLEDHRGGVYRLAFSADGSTLAVASYRFENPKFFGEVKLWDPATGRERAVFKDKINFLRSLALSPDGKLLAVAGSKELTGPNDLKLIDVATGRDLAVLTIPKTDWVMCLAFSPDGRLLAGGTGKALTLWDVLSAPGERK